MTELKAVSGKAAGQSRRKEAEETVDVVATSVCGQESKQPVVEYAAPRTPVEEVVAGIWAEALRVSRVGIRDNFFDLGGHSLTAMRIVALVCSTLQADVSLRNLFDAPTVEEFSAIVVSKESKPGQAERIAGFIRSLGSSPTA